MYQGIAIHWFRQDLRLLDNPALTKAAEHETVLPVYILDDVNAGDYAMGAASRWWLHYSLQALKESLNGKLSIYKGNPIDILTQLHEQYTLQAIYWNRCYEPWRVERDAEIKKSFQEKGVMVKSYKASLLWEPWEVKKEDGSPYKVFTPFYRKGCLKSILPRQPLPKPKETDYLHNDKYGLSLEQLELLPTIPWGQKLKPHWHIGEQGAWEGLKSFINTGLLSYKEGRNYPAKPFVSRLSPHIHFGEISPHQLWHAVRDVADDKHIDHFSSELGWREFSYSQLYHNLDLPKKNLQSKFDKFAWQENKSLLHAWQKGKTGIPMVDAGMRELWQTGYLHNRSRMVVGSFLVKNLRLHWRHGERWFWDTLVDADLANNSASWQWVAGCGADAAPYFRIFNPVTQGKKFDAEGEYVRHFVPEIAKLPNQYLFNPWEAPATVLAAAKVELGKDYPQPVVDLKASRNAALEAFQSLE